MVFVNTEIQSHILNRNMSVQLFFPNNFSKKEPKIAKGVLTLLHGYGNSANNWILYSSVVQYANENDLILIVPNADNSFYTDMVHGGKFYTWLTSELPLQLSEIFKIPSERNKNFIAGLSMGGYGALKIGLSNPNKYAACGSFSGFIANQSFINDICFLPGMSDMLSPAFGEKFIIKPEDDIFELTKRISHLPKEQQPKIFFTCGLQDALLSINHNYLDLLQTLNLEFKFNESAGSHEWNFWDRSVAEFIEYILGNDYAQKLKEKWNAPYHNV